jgi:hypothetical protein
LTKKGRKEKSQGTCNASSLPGNPLEMLKNRNAPRYRSTFRMVIVVFILVSVLDKQKNDFAAPKERQS